MNAPPVLRPLRIIFQRQLQTARARHIQTSYYLRASQFHRLQRRYNSSRPPKQPTKSDKPTTQETQTKPAVKSKALNTENLSGSTTSNAEGLTYRAAAAAEQSVSNNDKAPRLKSGGGEVKASLDELYGDQLKKTHASLAAFYTRYKRAQTSGLEVGGNETASAPPEDSQSAPKESQLAVGSAEMTDTYGSQEAREALAALNKRLEAAVAEEIEAVRPAKTDATRLEHIQVAVAKETLSIPDEETRPTVYLNTKASNAARQRSNAAEAPASAAHETEVLTPAMTPTTLSIPDFANLTPPHIAAMMVALQDFQAKHTQGATLSPPAPAPVPAPAPTTSTETLTPRSTVAPDLTIPDSAVAKSATAQTAAAMIEPGEPSGEAISQRHATTSDSTVSEDEVIDSSTGPHMEDTLAFVSQEAESHRNAAKDANGDEERTEEETPLASILGSHKPDLRQGELKEGPKAGKSKAERQVARMEYEKGPSRLPRTVQALYLQPLRRQAEYGVPSCDLQLRSYSLRPLESFADFALRAAYYLGLPAAGPVPLPKIVERWTVPRASFIFKKSQENFERITRRRLIQIKDGHPETVQIWLAFLQKHQQPAVGMKANIWEFSSLDVAKEMDAALEESKKLFKLKEPLLAQIRDFETPEKADEFLQSEKYRQFGGQFGGPDIR